MTVSGAAAEMTVAVTPTAPMESALSVVEPDVDEDGSETEEGLAGSTDMTTSMQ
jgi:hypothetical protein